MPTGSSGDAVITPPSCNLPTGTETTFIGRYKHYGVQPPNYYYPGIEQNPISVSDITCVGGSGDGICPIRFGYDSPLLPAINPFSRTYREKQNLSVTVSADYYQVLAIPPAYGTQYTGCVAKPYIMIVGGEFPPDLTVNMESGLISGTISDMDLFVEYFKLPDGFRFNETNYATKGSAGAYRNGLGAIIAADFVVRAFDPGYTGWYSDRKFTLRLSNWWSSDRDRFILDITGPFAIDGRTITSNSEYLNLMKQKGFWGN